jgi:hypothetical protein
MGDGSVVDGTVASSISQAAAIWRVREGISEALTKRGESWRSVSEESNSVRSEWSEGRKYRHGVREPMRWIPHELSMASLQSHCLQIQAAWLVSNTNLP